MKKMKVTLAALILSGLVSLSVPVAAQNSTGSASDQTTRNMDRDDDDDHGNWGLLGLLGLIGLAGLRKRDNTRYTTTNPSGSTRTNV